MAATPTGSAQRVPGSERNAVLYFVVLTYEEMSSLVHVLENVLAEPGRREGFECEDLAYAASGMMAIKWRFQGRK